MNDYKFMPIILKEDKDGKIKITEEKLKEMLQDAYNNGFEDGRNSQPVTTPITPSPTIPQPYWNDEPFIYPNGLNTQTSTKHCREEIKAIGVRAIGSGNLGDIKVEGEKEC